MSILDKLACALGRRDEVPNQELAKQVAAKKDTRAVAELVLHLENKKKDIQSDCIKVLYEIGEMNPMLIADYSSAFAKLLDSKNNRMQWGAMAALAKIATINPKGIYKYLPKIISVSDNGSVITKDNAVRILVAIGSVKQYADDAFTLLITQLKACPENQLPMYAELSIPIIADKNKAVFIKTLQSRLKDIEKESKQKRIEKVIKKVQ